MFSVAPKYVEPTIVLKKGRKNKEIALEHFEKSMVKIEESVVTIENIIKLTDLSPVETRKNLRNALRDVKEIKKLLTKYKNIQYKPKRTRESHNTGLEKLRPISENMALFADWEYGVTQKSRYDVTNELCKYIKDNELRTPDNKTIITPDSKLKKLLQVEDDVVLKYPTMQKYLKHCFEEPTPLPIKEDDPNELLKPVDAIAPQTKGQKVKDEKARLVEEKLIKKSTTESKTRENKENTKTVKKDSKTSKK